MNTNSVRTPTLSEFKAAGYVVEVKHSRLRKVAYTDCNTGKLVVKTVLGYPNLMPPSPDGQLIDAGVILGETLPKGGKTEVWVTDPETSAEFYGFAVCHSHENYNKRLGVTKALDRIVGLMLVMDGKEGFKMRLQC